MSNKRRTNSRGRAKPAADKRENNPWPGNTPGGIFDGAPYGGAPNSFPYQLGYDNAYNPLSLNQILLTYAYMTHGVIQTAIDQPVEDGLRGGIEIKCDELDAEDIQQVQEYLENFNVLKTIKLALQWDRLYGGAGVIINTNQDPTTPLNEESIGQDSPLAFIDADRWELCLSVQNYVPSDIPYNYYGQRIHESRVIKLNGKEAPAFLRQRLQGWGMSELERIIRPLQAYTKNEDVIYQLLDEAKIDVWKIEQFNQQILSAAAQGKTHQRLQIANQLKNYHRAIVMDKEDDYEQKQITFAGLPDILKENRIGCAGSVRMPMSKLFGLSAQGFASGEDDIENYNALVESNIRSRMRDIFRIILPLICRQLFGYAPEHIEFSFQPLRMLGAEAEENVKNAKFNRLSSLYSQGMLTPMEYSQALKAEKIFNMDTEVSRGQREPEPPQTVATVAGPGDTVPKVQKGADDEL